jgi:succinoglycan biosynthesis protein ExoM
VNFTTASQLNHSSSVISSEADHISVCVCTYKRPKLLGRLIGEIQHQTTKQLFTYSVVVVDNDSAQSAKDTVKSFRAKSSVLIDYCVEPEQNISLARNRAVRNAKGNFVAFLDDDEFPLNTWLLNLYQTQGQYAADGVLGPVKPYFESEPPAWILKGKICERKSYVTGTVLKKPRDTRTGNVLFAKRIFDSEQNPFNPDFGKTGGEDVDFFRRMMLKGFTFIWCNEASVYESVPAERLTWSYHLKRALLRGMVSLQSPPLKIKIISVAKSLIAAVVYSLMLPFCLIAGVHIFMKYLIRYFDHIGKLMAAVGFHIIKERNF